MLPLSPCFRFHGNSFRRMETETRFWETCFRFLPLLESRVSRGIMNTTNRHIHLRGLLPSKPPPWRHRRRSNHIQYLRLVLIHLHLFLSAKYANTPLKTTPIKTILIKTTPIFLRHSLPILSHISANHNKINSTSLYHHQPPIHPNLPHHQPPIHPNLPHSPSTNRPFYLPQLPCPTAPIFLIVNPLPTHASSSNSYVNSQKKFCHSTTHNLYANTHSSQATHSTKYQLTKILKPHLNNKKVKTICPNPTRHSKTNKKPLELRE